MTENDKPDGRADQPAPRIPDESSTDRALIRAEAGAEVPGGEASDPTAGAESGPAAGEGPPPPSPRPLWPRFATGLAFTLALLATAGVAFVWSQYRAFYVTLQDADVEIEGAIERVRAAQRGLSDRMETLEAAAEASRARAERAVEQVRGVPGRVDDLERRLGVLPDRVAALERQLDTLQGGSFDAQATWLRAEAEYYLAVANAELELAGRWENAATALELADGRLRVLADPALAPVRRQIADDLLALESVERPDVERIVFDLASLARRVDELPLRSAATGRADEAASLDDAEPGFDRLMASVRRALGSLVTVERRDEAEERIVSAERRALARRELGTELALARVGALQAEPAAYSASLRAAAALLERDFDVTDPRVRAAAARVRELAAIDIAPPRPEISRSLALLRELDPGAD